MQNPKPKVYVETTIVSYLAANPSRDPVTAARQALTRQWWERDRFRYELVASSEVHDEARRGFPVMVERRLAILRHVSIFQVEKEIMELSARLKSPGALPAKAGSDAIHIAAASIEGCGFLMTWNLRHIANPAIRRKVDEVLKFYGYSKTNIGSPGHLLGSPLGPRDH